MADFNPRSPCGERLSFAALRINSRVFQSTLPVWGATCGPFLPARPKLFQSTLPVWGATPERKDLKENRAISIHAPRVGSDDLDNLKTEVERLFQSTLPVWGATRLLPVMPLPSKFQSTLPVWGATHGPIFQSIFGSISIHAPRVGSDISALRMLLSKEHFNPRSPCGERPETG